MLKKFSNLLVLLFLAFTSKIYAGDSMVLIHGFAGDAKSWHKEKVIRVLNGNGLRLAGYGYFDYRSGTRLETFNLNTDRKIFNLKLPYRAPIEFQASVVERILTKITEKYPDDNIHLVGHSAGGIVGRLIVINNKFPRIKTLITIASPHLGTRRAEMALDFTDLPFPLSFMAETGGGKIYDKFQSAETLFTQLVRARPGTFLYWLNSQPHPEINYFSIVRKRKSFFERDFMVKRKNQDMNLVPALAGRAGVFMVGKSHFLSYKDGIAISRIMHEVLKAQ